MNHASAQRAERLRNPPAGAQAATERHATAPHSLDDQGHNGGAASIAASLNHPNVIEQLERIAACEITADERDEALHANLASLRCRCVGIVQTNAYVTARRAERWFRLDDGSVAAVTPAGSRRMIAWPEEAAARTLDNASVNAGAPVYAHALPSLCIVDRLARREHPELPGYRQPIFIIDPSNERLLDVLSTADASKALADHTALVACGPDAAEALRRFLDDNLGREIKGVIISGGNGDMPQPIADIIEQAVARQGLHARTLRQQLDARYALRSADWWAERFRAPQTPLRALILSVRYSTFVRHSSEDIADGLRNAGLDVCIDLEPDHRTRLTSLSRLQSIDRFDPDLIICINYTRQQMHSAVPAGPPFVCWIQDALPTLSDPQTWHAHTDRDFVAGHIKPELLDRFGIDQRRTIHAPVPVSTRKFYPRATTGTTSDQFDRDIAIITNHSEPLEACKHRLAEQAGGSRDAHTLVEMLDEACIQILRDTTATLKLPRIRQATHDAATSLSVPPEQHEMCYTHFALPLAERRWRHDALLWSIELSREAGLRIAVFGNGWERHPEAAAFNLGPLQHGEQLRRVYERSLVTVHASIHGHQHQRVFETALSGGFPAIRLMPDEIKQIRDACGILALHRKPPTGTCKLTGWPFIHVAEDEYLLRATTMIQRIDWQAKPVIALPHEHIAKHAQRLRSIDELWALGQPDAYMFRDKAELQALVRRARTRPAWRTSISRLASTRIQRSLSYDAVTQRLIAHITRCVQPAHTTKEAA